MSIIVIKRLVCDFPGCDVVKNDLIWWESVDEDLWEHTTDGRDWCPDHTREEIRALPIHRTEAGYPHCSTCDGGGCYDCTDPA